MGTKPSIFQPGHDGRPQGVPNAPGMHGPARGADAFKGHHVPGNIARDGAAKVHHDVPVHGGMTARQHELKGMGHSIGSAPDASAASPLDPPPQMKRFDPAPPVPGQRSRTRDTLHHDVPGANDARNRGHGAQGEDRDLGVQIMREAFGASSKDDMLAHMSTKPGGCK
jgi:hypothetical protein